MKKTLIFFIFFLAIIPNSYAQDILIVADEIPTMGVLAKAFKNEHRLEFKIVKQAEVLA